MSYILPVKQQELYSHTLISQWTKGIEVLGLSCGKQLKYNTQSKHAITRNHSAIRKIATSISHAASHIIPTPWTNMIIRMSYQDPILRYISLTLIRRRQRWGSCGGRDNHSVSKLILHCSPQSLKIVPAISEGHIVRDLGITPYSFNPASPLTCLGTKYRLW